MSEIKFIHAADMHLGRQFSGLHQSSPELADLFRRAGYSAWETLVRTATERKVDFLTLAGDVFDSQHTTVKARVAFIEGLHRLHDAGITVFMALGNHDPLRSFPDSLRSLQNLRLFGPDPESIEATQGVRIFGASFEKSVVTENLARKFKRDTSTDLAVAILHANVSGYSEHKNYAPCSLDDLRKSGMDVWCLGHVHSARILSADPLIFYPGAGQGAHAGETGSKGCYIVSVKAGKKGAAEFISLAPVRWDKIELNATNLSEPEDLLGSTEEACAGLASEDVKAVVVRINITGTPSDHVSQAIKSGEIYEILMDRLPRLGVPVFPESVCDLTHPGFDLGSMIDDEGFLPEFLRLCRRSSEDPYNIEDIIREVHLELSRRVHRSYIAEDADPMKLLENRASLTAFVTNAAEQVASTFFELSTFDLLNQERT
jgi:exonuclease SbcD